MNITLPVQDKKTIEMIIDKIKTSKSAYITMHARPDGDAIGASLALYRILKKLGVKDVQIVAPDEPPQLYGFLKNIELIKTEFINKETDIGFILDCSDRKRLEKIPGILDFAKTLINIDHHRFNQVFGNINYIKPDCSSTSEMIFNIAYHLGIEFDYDIALYLYIGIVTDTNQFQEENTTPQAHAIAAYFIDKFLSPVEVSSYIYGTKTIKILNLTSKAIDSIKITPSKKIAYITITPQILTETGTFNEDLEGIINFARNIKNVEVGILLRKMTDKDSIKVSFRSKGKIDVSKIANHFGGGGHHNASGCSLDGDFDEVTEKILQVLNKEFN